MAYPTGPESQYSYVYPHYRRSGARYPFSRPCEFRGRCLLYHGQRLHRFSSPVPTSSTAILFCHPSQKQAGVFTKSFPSGDQNSGPVQRPNHLPDGPEKFDVLSRTSTAYPLCRCRTSQTFFLSDQQLPPVALDDRSAVQVSLADRIILQMDQATSSHQGILRHYTQYGKDPSVNRHQRLCAGGNPEKRTRPGGQHVRNSTSD